MSGHEAAAHHTVTGVDNRRFGIWVLIASECFLFGTLIANYLISKAQFLANKTEGLKLPGPAPEVVYDLDITTLSTFDLLMSSVAMVLALHYCKVKDLAKFRLWTGVVVLGGVIFLGFQYYEFTHFAHEIVGGENAREALKLSTNIFGSSFFLLTGCHGLHVAAGVLIMSSILILSFIRGAEWFDSDVVEVAGLYWHFVDVVWIVIFTVVYLFVYL